MFLPVGDAQVHGPGREQPGELPEDRIEVARPAEADRLCSALSLPNPPGYGALMGVRL